MMVNDAMQVFERSKENPIIRVSDIPYPANSVFNAAATEFKNEILLLMRVEDRRGISHFTTATSRNGVTDWTIGETPVMKPCLQAHEEEQWGIEDPRITYLPETKKWIIAYTAYSKFGPMVALALTEDFVSFERLGAVMPPVNKDAALFPVRFNGRWAMIHRPVSPYDGAHIWISFSPDLIHWGEHHVLVEARSRPWWDSAKVGLSPQPIRTDEGWLILYHGVKTTAAGSIYRNGLALLDLEKPTKLIARSDEWVFSPEEEYERTGDVDNVVFPCGWMEQDNNIRIYYGSADSCIATASASKTSLLAWLRNHNSLIK
ncbi:cytoplasmic protein [Candidatus Scalindua japonica]|uniref:Cytoplasmic protein n=1 Tax=Candidatus Scalindua japonica TaxID=1284222 RepID=A0A286U1Y9_9BACT|nr:glycosidase [Candidatus Scalindua japonica]GAX62137.1 cytoplasmic protein [Candidatus Scalindua japonica]